MKRKIGPNDTTTTGFSRRRFLKYSSGMGIGVAALASGMGTAGLLATTARNSEAAAAPADTSRVVIVRSEDLFGDANPKKDQVGWMLGAGMGSLFDAEDPIIAWKALFKPDDVVGIKVNCIAGPNLSSHPHVVQAIVSELQKIPIPAENIIIWDRKNRELSRAGYTLNTDKKGVKCYGTDTATAGYEERSSSRGSFSGRLSTILTREITALINVPILKDHGSAGVTVSMKNHYGSIHNPGSHHGHRCDPYVADLNSVDDIKDKTRLIVCDATTAGCNGGPGYKPGFAWRYSGLILSTDPVALDTVGTRVIDERRSEIGLPTLAEAGRYPPCLASAAERGLGNTEMRRIDLRNLKV